MLQLKGFCLAIFKEGKSKRDINLEQERRKEQERYNFGSMIFLLELFRIFPNIFLEHTVCYSASHIVPVDTKRAQYIKTGQT